MPDWEKLTENLTKHGFTVHRFAAAKEAAAFIDGHIDGKTVALGGSVTLRELGLDKLLGVGRNYDVISRDLYIGAWKGRLYVIDGYGDDGVIERITSFLLGQGAAGVILYDKEKNIIAHYDTVKTNEIVNTVGAGNALFSCFLHFYNKTHDSVFAVKNALLFASYKIGFMGTSNGFMSESQISQWRNLIWRDGR